MLHKSKFIIAVLPALMLPVYGSWITKAPWMWSVSVSLYIGSLLWLCRLLPGLWFRRGLFLLFSGVLFVIEGAYFVSYYVQNAGFNDAFFYHLSLDTLHGGIGEYSSFIASFLILFACCVVLGWWVVSKKTYFDNYIWLVPAYLVLVGFAFSPSLKSLSTGIKYINPPSAGTEIYDQFRALQDPRVRVTSVPHERPNIILIFGESLEQRYFDEKVFPGLVPNLRRLRESSVDFTNVKQGPSAGWTIGGMVASMCGYPLANGFGLGGGDLRIFEDFMPKATCLSDVLKGSGYTLTYVGGADSGFSGKDRFLMTHGYTEIIDRDDFIRESGGREYHSVWGAYDDTLLDRSYSRFEELSEQGRPFMLTLLTLDTHHPKGWPSKSCKPYPNRNNDILDAVYCSDQLIPAFIDKVRSSKHSDRTIIVFFSDHLSQRNRATHLLESSQQPERLTFFINDAEGSGRSINYPGTHFDFASTLLDYLGYHYEGQFGFGRSILDQPGYLDGRFGDDAWSDKEDTMLAIASKLWDQSVKIDTRGIQFGRNDLVVNFGGKEFNLRSAGLSDAEMAPTLFVFNPETLVLEEVKTYPFSKGVTETSFSKQILQYHDKLVLAIGLGWQMSGFTDPGTDLDKWAFYCGRPNSYAAALGNLRSGLTISFPIIESIVRSPVNPRIIRDREHLLARIEMGIKPGS